MDESGSLFLELKKRFPEFPDAVITGFMKQNGNDRDQCIRLLEMESEHFLYSQDPNVVNQLYSMHLNEEPERRNSFSSNASNSSSRSIPHMNHSNSQPSLDSRQQPVYPRPHTAPVMPPGFRLPYPQSDFNSYENAHYSQGVAQQNQLYVQNWISEQQNNSAASVNRHSTGSTVNRLPVSTADRNYDTHLTVDVDPPVEKPNQPKLEIYRQQVHFKVNSPRKIEPGRNSPCNLNVPGYCSPVLSHSSGMPGVSDTSVGYPLAYSPEVQRQISQASSGSRHSHPSGGSTPPPALYSTPATYSSQFGSSISSTPPPALYSTPATYSSQFGSSISSTPPPVLYSTPATSISRPNVLPIEQSEHNLLDETSNVQQTLTPMLTPTHGGLPENMATTPEDPAYTHALILHQHARIEKLQRDIEVSNHYLTRVQEDVSVQETMLLSWREQRALNSDSHITAEDMKTLREENRRLLIEIQCMTREIDLFENGQMPLGVVDPVEQQNFFSSMASTGQMLPQQLPRNVLPVPPRRPLRPEHPEQPPPLPPHSTNIYQRTNCAVHQPETGPRHPGFDPRLPGPGPHSQHTPYHPGHVPHQSESGPRPLQPQAETSEGEQWNCSFCTLLNHPALDRCEVCEMPRITANTTGDIPPARPPRPPPPVIEVTGTETGDWQIVN